MLPCAPDFLQQLAIDFGVTEANREKVGKKLAQTYAFYQTQVTGESLTQIVDTSQRAAVEEFAKLERVVEGALKYFVISAVIAVLVLSLFGFYIFSRITDSALFFVTFLVLLLVTCGFLYYSFYKKVREEVTLFTKAVDTLYTELVAQVLGYVTTQEAALESAVCYYGNIM